MSRPTITIVIPTIGRSSLGELLDRLDEERVAHRDVIVVDDRPDAATPIDALARRPGMRVLHTGGGRGPAAARNAGWRAAAAEWIEFLDDDVIPEHGWFAALMADLDCDGRPGASNVGASEGNIRVPLPAHRKPTDWERNISGLASARWATADMAYRREALEAVGGFDERFPRAFREDADLALRTIRSGYTIVKGARRIIHPVRPADAMVSVRLQAGNADDALMTALHGRGWHRRAEAPRGRFPTHAFIVTLAAAALFFAAARVPRPAILCAAMSAGAIIEFAWSRIAPGPKTPRELGLMLMTSVLIPFAAVYHRVRGALRVRRLRKPQAILFDRDGTLIADRPPSHDAQRVVVSLMPSARRALRRIRKAGVKTAVITNQDAVAKGLCSEADVAAVNDALTQALEGIGPVFACVHHADERCDCRKPAPGLVNQAARALGVDPRRCVVIGDIGSDCDAAQRAGARSVLVPTPLTRPEEIRKAALVARSLEEAVAIALRAAL